MKTWLHRISHHAEASYPLLEKGFLTIGFSDLHDPLFLERTKAKDWDYFEEAIREQWGDSPRTRHNLWRFIVEMQPGDLVVVPSWGTFSVYRIESEAQLVRSVDAHELPVWNDETLLVTNEGLRIGERALDLGFFRKVSAIAVDISRYEYVDAALTSRMKLRATNADISDLQASVTRALDAFHNKRPINLHSQILEASAEQLLERIQNELNPDKFEALIAWYFRRLGASEVSIPAKNEGGKQGDADIIAVFEPLKTIYYVQAKHHRGMTSDWAAQQISEYKDHKDRMDDGYSRIGWVVSTAETFSHECVELAKANSVGLFTGKDITRMILEAGIQNLDKAF